MRRKKIKTMLLATSLCGVLLLLAPKVSAVDLLPDLFPWAHDRAVDGTPPFQDLIYNGVFDTTSIANKVLYRFHVALTNIGQGPLQVREFTHEEGGLKTEQTIYQQVLQDDQTFREITIDTFPYPPAVPGGFGHLRFPGLAQYNIRDAIPNGEAEPLVGDLLSTHDKLSMGIVDSLPYNQPVPGAPANRVYESANDPILGISIGYADLYGRNLPGQWVEVTDLADGQYWLEVVIDPYERVLESDDTNNTTRILIDLTIPTPNIHPGDYNNDGVVDAADYSVWRDTLGGVENLGTGADGDGDGRITQLDYDVWKARFGQVAAGASLARAQVPEPPAKVQILLALFLLILCRGVTRSGATRARAWIATS